MDMCVHMCVHECASVHVHTWELKEPDLIASPQKLPHPRPRETLSKWATQLMLWALELEDLGWSLELPLIRWLGLISWLFLTSSSGKKVPCSVSLRMK